MRYRASSSVSVGSSLRLSGRGTVGCFIGTLLTASIDASVSISAVDRFLLGLFCDSVLAAAAPLKRAVDQGSCEQGDETDIDDEPKKSVQIHRIHSPSATGISKSICHARSGSREPLFSEIVGGNRAIEEELMNPRNQSGYDPVGDPRTGRPPLPEDRDRARRARPDEIDSDSPDSSNFAGAHSGELENREGEAGDRSTLGRFASEGSDALRAATGTVTSQVGAATSVAMERSSEFCSV